MSTQPAVNAGRAIRNIKLNETVSDMCGVTMNDSVEGRVVAQIMEKKPGVTVKYYPAMIRIDGRGKLEFDMNEISEALGRPMDPYTFQIEMSTHYGRMVLFDDKIVLFGNLDEALQYEQ
jgi:propane monooxygenase coupling protein